MKSANKWNEGDPVWCKNKNLPWWPAVIANDNCLPVAMLNEKPTSNHVPVYFFGKVPFFHFMRSMSLNGT